MRIIILLFSLFVSSSIFAENATVEMLNKLEKENMVYSNKIVKVEVGDTVFWKATDKGHNVEFIMKGGVPEGVEKFTLKGFIAETWGKVKFWLKSLLSWASEEDENDSIIVKYVKKAITGIKDWFGKMFDFSSAAGVLKSYINVLTFLPNMIKDAIFAVTEWLLGLFGFDEAAKKVANANEFSIGDMVMNVLKTVWE